MSVTINRARIGSVSLDCPDSTTLAGVFATLFGVEVAYTLKAAPYSVLTAFDCPCGGLRTTVDLPGPTPRCPSTSRLLTSMP